jgi:hypothetical protein
MLMRTGAIRSTIAVLTFAAAACTPGAEQSSIVVRDSAGVLIVENAMPAWSDGESWQVDSEPALAIGVLDGGPQYQFFRVRSAARLPDGRMVVANGGTLELRLYDVAGRFVRSIGRQGEGPGEFRGLGALDLLDGDSLAVFDNRLRRVSIFDTNGAFARSFQFGRGGSGFMYPIGWLPGGEFVARAAPARPALPGMPSGVYRDSVWYLHADAHGAVIDTIGQFPGTEMYVRADDRSASVTVLAFGRIAHAAVAGDQLWYGSGDVYELAQYTVNGRLQRLARKAHTRLAVTNQDIEELKRQRINAARDRNSERFTERMFAAMPFPDLMPAHGQVIADASGNLWVEETRRPADARPRWTVFAPGGHMLGLVATPPGLRITDIGHDYLLGVWRDELDVEHVRLHRLHKPD